MEIQIRISVSDNSIHQDKVNLVYGLTNQLNTYFASYNYGDDVKKVDIGFLMVMERPGYEDWYKPKKPKYVAYKTKKSNLTGETLVIEKTFSYEIRLSDEQLYKFIGDDEEFSKQVLATEIINSLPNFDVLSKSVKDFDKERFKEDIKQFLEEQYKS